MGKTWGQGSTRNSRATRQTVLERDHFECSLKYDCCTWAATEVHHVHSITERQIRRADATNPDDCIAVCAPCHARVTERQRLAAQQQMNAIRAARRKLPQRPHPGER
jgi:5-methylcytosine-specific restriction endonuclease McrA